MWCADDIRPKRASIRGRSARGEGCYASDKDDFLPLPELVERFGELGWDVVDMVLADQDSWDRYVAAQREYLGWGVFALMTRSE